jgi:hypothetical protein
VEFFLQSLGTPQQALGAVANFSGLAYLVGQMLVRALPGLSPRNQFFFSLILGIDFLILATVPLVRIGLLFTFFPRLLLGIGLGGLGYLFWKHLRVFRGKSIPWVFYPFYILGLILLGNALTYPFSWDDLTYQIAVPLRWRQTGSLDVFLDNPYSGFPGAFAIANVFLVSTGGILAPKVFNALLWLIVSLQTYFLIRDHTRKWTAVAITLSFTLSLPMLMVSMAAFAELFLLLQVIGIFSFLNRALCRESPPSSRELMLLGFCSGMAASVKLTGLIVPMATGGFLVGWYFWTGSRKGQILRQTLAFGLPMLMVFGAFYSRPTLATGNPFYPYFAPLFADHPATLETSAYHHDAGYLKFGPTMESPLKVAGYFPATPILLALGPLNLKQFDGNFGLQFLVHYLLIGFLIWSSWRGKLKDSRPWVWLGFALVFYCFWFFTSRQARFLLPTYFLVVLTSSFALRRFSLSGQVAISILLVVLTLGTLPLRVYKQFVLASECLRGNITPADFIYSGTEDGYLQACQEIMKHTPSSARVLLLFEQRGLYVPRTYFIGTPCFQERFFTPVEEVKTEEDILQVFLREKITHVLVGFTTKDPDQMKKYLDKTQLFREKLTSLLYRSPHFVLRHQGEGYGLFELIGARSASKGHH